MEPFCLSCFIAVAESGSFTKAAATVCRTQSAVTQQISNLEKKLGVSLFHRGKKVTLTREGELFLPYALKIYSINQEVLDRLKNPELDGEVRFGVPEDFATLLLSDVLFNFSRIHPRIFLNVECDLTLNLFERFKKGALDLVLVKMSSPQDFPHGVEVWTEPLVWVSKSGYPPERKENEPLPLVVSPEPCIYRARAIAALEKAGIRWRLVYSSPSYAGKIAAVRAAMGITVLPITMIPEGLSSIPTPLLPRLPDIHVSLLKQEGALSPATESLREFILKKLTQAKHHIGTK